MKRYLAALIIVLPVFFANSAFSQTATLKRSSNLRKSATSSSAIIEELPAGAAVTLISNTKRSGYYHVHAEDGQAGWVLARNVKVSEAAEARRAPRPGAAPTGGQAFDPGCALPFDSIKQKHPIDDTCDMDGLSSNGGRPTEQKVAENHVKNDFCKTGAPVDISYQDLLQLEKDRQNVRDPDLPNADVRKQKLENVITVNGHSIGEGTLVRLVIHVIQGKADYADTAKQGFNGESVNCCYLSEQENDIHIPLGEQTHGDETLSVTAEMSPHFRPAKWTPEDVNSVGEHPIRVTGQLFYDSSHRAKNGKRTGPKRASLWEIHPVYAFEVCGLTDDAACKAAPDSEWKPLDQFAP
jgi:uncharacterized protein YgiM (DUF1202 family)